MLYARSWDHLFWKKGIYYSLIFYQQGWRCKVASTTQKSAGTMGSPAAYPPRVPKGAVVLSCPMVWSHVLSNLFWDRVYVEFSLYLTGSTSIFAFRGSTFSIKLLCKFPLKETQGRVVVILLTPAGWCVCRYGVPEFASALGYPYTIFIIIKLSAPATHFRQDLSKYFYSSKLNLG